MYEIRPVSLLTFTAVMTVIFFFKKKHLKQIVLIFFYLTEFPVLLFSATFAINVPSVPHQLNRVLIWQHNILVIAFRKI